MIKEKRIECGACGVLELEDICYQTTVYSLHRVKIKNSIVKYGLIRRYKDDEWYCLKCGRALSASEEKVFYVFKDQKRGEW